MVHSVCIVLVRVTVKASSRLGATEHKRTALYCKDESVAVESAARMKFNHLTLTQKDQEILSNLAGWLNDSFIQVAQSLWKKKQFPGYGVCQLCCGEERIYPDSLHTSHGHWLTVSTLGLVNDSEVMMYDSLYSTM